MTIEELKLMVTVALSRYQDDWAFQSQGRLWSYYITEFSKDCIDHTFSEYYIELWAGDRVEVCVQRTSLVINKESDKLEAWQHFLSDLLKSGIGNHYRSIVQAHRSNDQLFDGNSLSPKEKL